MSHSRTGQATSDTTAGVREQSFEPASSSQVSLRFLPLPLGVATVVSFFRCINPSLRIVQQFLALLIASASLAMKESSSSSSLQVELASPEVEQLGNAWESAPGELVLTNEDKRRCAAIVAVGDGRVVYFCCLATLLGDPGSKFMNSFPLSPVKGGGGKSAMYSNCRICALCQRH